MTDIYLPMLIPCNCRNFHIISSGILVTIPPEKQSLNNPDLINNAMKMAKKKEIVEDKHGRLVKKTKISQVFNIIGYPDYPKMILENSKTKDQALACKRAKKFSAKHSPTNSHSTYQSRDYYRRAGYNQRGPRNS